MHRRGSGLSRANGDIGSKIVPISVRVPEAIRMTGLCRTTIYELIASGDLEASKVGRSTVIMVESLRSLLLAHRIRPADINGSP